MDLIDKERFQLALKLRPLVLIGKEIIYKEHAAKILDVSVSGDFVFLETRSTRRLWELADGIGDIVTMAEDFPISKGNSFTVVSLTSSIDTLDKLVGHPGNEHTKSLFEIVESINKDILELKLKIEEMEKSKGIKL